MVKKRKCLQDPHLLAKDKLIEELDSDFDNGLNSRQVQRRFEQYGPNELPKIKTNIWKIYLAPLFNFLIIILLISGIIIALFGSIEETIITFIVIIINSLTAIFQQFRAQKALESLRKITALKTTVIRDGIEHRISTKDLVPGDIVLVKQGDKIPADGRILHSINLSLNEAPLTGESESVDKSDSILYDESSPIQQQKNMVFMGTFVHTGRGRILITHTGIQTEIGDISDKLNKMGSIELIPLTKKLNRIGYILGFIAIIILCVLILYKGLLLHYGVLSESLISILSSALIKAINVFPVNLPLLVTLVLIMGVLNMAKKGVIIKNLSAIESLGRVSIICADKTGTITKNEMTVKKIWIPPYEYKVTGSGYMNNGDIITNDQIIDKNNKKDLEIFFHSISVNNNAKFDFQEVKTKSKSKQKIKIRQPIGSSTEAALLVLLEKAGYDQREISKKYSLLKEFSFNSQRKMMTTICCKEEFGGSKKVFIFNKGAPENVLEKCSFIKKESEVEELLLNIKERILNLTEAYAEEGYRVLAVSYRTMEMFSNEEREKVESNLIFLGIICIMDPPRKQVKVAVKKCKSANIRVIMITGDHPATSKTVASEVAIYNEDDLITIGDDIEKISNNEFKKTSVFARVNPSDKEIIVEKLQGENKIVAMTGDGINDSLALRKADAAIALGITGTDVAKEVSDMIITDDNFSSIEKGVEIGRSLFSKIRSIIYFFLCLNIMEAVIFFGYEFFPGYEIFSSNWQILYIANLAHTFPALALLLDKKPKNIMLESPRNEEQILNKNMWLMLCIQAFLIGISLVLVFQFTNYGIISLNNQNIDSNLSYIITGSTQAQLISQKARTMLITTLMINETLFLWTFRRPNLSLIESLKNEFYGSLLLISIFPLILHILLILYSYPVNLVINEILGLNFQLNYMFLSFDDWLFCLIFSIPGIFGIEFFKSYARKNQIYF